MTWPIEIGVAPGLHLPLEPLLLIPFLVKLSSLRKEWREEAGD